MKKKDKIWLAGDILIGVILMVTGVWISVDYYSTLIFAMGFGLTCSAVSQFIRHYYHTRPENIEAYREKMRRQEIYLKDERKIQLRNQAGYITWAGTMVLCFIGAFVAALLHSEPLIIGLLAGAAVVQYLAATVVYKYLCKKM